MNPAKRAFDLFWVVPGLIALLPVFAAIAAAIKLTSPGPVFFVQTRVGRGGRPFRMLKFRSMTADAEQRGPQLTAHGDPRITPVGQFLRKTKLDELPQLLNVLRGEMSLVGPRPEVPRYVDLYTPQERRVLELTPGITDPASIAYRREEELLAAAADPEAAYVTAIMPHKIRINLEYASRATPLTDFLVVVATLLGCQPGILRPGPRT